MKSFKTSLIGVAVAMLAITALSTSSFARFGSAYHRPYGEVYGEHHNPEFSFPRFGGGWGAGRGWGVPLVAPYSAPCYNRYGYRVVCGY